MRHTVAAIFENETQAVQARSELIGLGIPDDDIFVRNESSQAQYRTSPEATDEGSGIGGFFKRLFGFADEDKRATYYSRAISEGRYLVAVDAASEDQAERAADLMQHLGAVEIDDDIDDLVMGDAAGGGAAPLGGRRGVRVYARNDDLSPEEKVRLRGQHGARGADLGAQQLAASGQPHRGPHLETMEDDPYTPTPDETRQQE